MIDILKKVDNDLTKAFDNYDESLKNEIKETQEIYDNALELSKAIKALVEKNRALINNSEDR